MITKISDGIYTASFSEIADSKEEFKDDQIVDVRHLVDRSGNDINDLLKAIDDAKTIYQQKGRVVITCDMGISRSRVVAIGLLTKLGMPVDDAIKHVLKTSQNSEINTELLLFLRSYFFKTNANNQTTKDIIVIGSNGFIGSTLSKYLDTNSFAVDKINKKDLDVQIDQLGLVMRLQLSTAKTVILCTHPLSYHTVNAMSSSIQMLKNTLEACRLTNKNFIFISSMNIFQGNAFQQSECDFSVSEKLMPIPRGTYSETKYLCEKLCDVYRTNYQMKILIVRPSGLYGIKMRPQWLIPKLISKALQNQILITHKYTNGLPAFELLHINDFCEAIKLILKKEIYEGSINIGTHSLITTLDLAKMISRLCQSKSTTELLEINEPIKNIVTMPGILDQYGWKSKITLEEGLSSYISTIRRNHN